MDGVYQTFKTLRTVNQCLFTSILYIQVNTIKVTILRKKKIQAKDFFQYRRLSHETAPSSIDFSPFSAVGSMLSSICRGLCNPSRFFYDMDRSGNLVETIPCHDEINAMVTLLLWNTHRTMQTEAPLFGCFVKALISHVFFSFQTML